MSNWLNHYFSAVIRYLGVSMPMRGTLEVVGEGVSVTDETLEDGTKVTRLEFTAGAAGTPAGSSTELQYRVNGSTFGAATNVVYVGGKLQFLASPQWKNSSFLGDLAWTPTANRTLTLPDVTDTLVGRATADTLTNKTINGSSNTITNVSLSTGVTGTLPGGSMQAASGLNAGSLSAADKSKLDGIQKQGATQSPASVGTTHTIDWSACDSYSKALAAGANTIAFANNASGMGMNIELIGDGSTVTWPAGIKWAGGTVPTQTASGRDVYAFRQFGSTIVGSVIQALS